MHRYGINFYNEKLDLSASTYFEDTDFFNARKKALEFEKEGWVSGSVFFIEERNHKFYVPIEDFLSKEEFDCSFDIIRISEEKVIDREAFETTAKMRVEAANDCNGFIAYEYKKSDLRENNHV